MLLLTVLALDPVRRRHYELFLLGHALWPPAMVLAWLHIRRSDAMLLSLFARESVLKRKHIGSGVNPFFRMDKPEHKDLSCDW